MATIDSSEASPLGRSRILFLVSSMNAGGAERVAALLCNHWAESGHDVTLMPTYSGRGGCAYPLHEGVHLDYLADRSTGTSNGLLTPLRRLFQLRDAVRFLAPDVIVSFLTNVNVAALIATVGMAMPVIVSERSFPPRQQIEMIWRLLRRITYRRAAAVVTQTARVAEWIQANCPKTRTTTIPNPVVVPIARSTPEIDPKSIVSVDRLVLLSVGRCVRDKGFDRLLSAYALLAKDIPDWDLVIIGDGPERANLKVLCEELKIADRVYLPGRAGNIGDWYERASIFALTSRYEGFPNVLLEAMAHGVAAISVDCATGPAEIIRHDVDGLLLPEGATAQEIAAAIGLLVRDGKMRTRMSARAREVVLRYSIDSVSLSWASLFAASRRV